MIVESEIGSQTRLAIRIRVVSKNIYIFILDVSPQLLAENVVEVPAFDGHRDPDAARTQDCRELGQSDLTAWAQGSLRIRV